MRAPYFAATVIVSYLILAFGRAVRNVLFPSKTFRASMRVAEARGVLEVGAHASQDEIRKAYRRAALRWHPDKNPGNTEAATMRFRQVHAAYLALQERAPDEATYTHGNARKEARKDNDVQNERQEQQMPTFEDSLRAFHSVFGNATASSL